MVSEVYYALAMNAAKTFTELLLSRNDQQEAVRNRTRRITEMIGLVVNAVVTESAAGVSFVVPLLPRVIALWPQIMGKGPVYSKAVFPRTRTPVTASAMIFWTWVVEILDRVLRDILWSV